MTIEPLVEPVALNRLRWRCRRGLLENDLLIERYFDRHGACITLRQADGLQALMELPDNDLLDLLLARSELSGELDRPAVREVLAQLRPPMPRTPA
ncbi:MAG: succinate dehydrogenase assembly factor 2 [Burkholderiaceae bacterium]|jgi:antitoxin CptB|nr:succinate dehydrogenase assembly factor 2 [Burkholderiaceae bacterium]